MRHSLLTPIPELELTAKLLDAAADAIILGQMDIAADLLRKSDLSEIVSYAKALVGKLSPEVHRIVKRPKCLPEHERDPARMPSAAEQKAIFTRDGWHCRFCGTKVICKSARLILIRLFPIESHWTSVEFQRHSALYAMASSLDHVVPHGRGGKNESSNFVTACYCLPVRQRRMDTRRGGGRRPSKPRTKVRLLGRTESVSNDSGPCFPIRINTLVEA